MTSLSPSTTYHAEIREQLNGVGRVLSLDRGVRWAARGLLLGLFVVLVLEAWAWSREQQAALPLALLVALPFAFALVGLLAAFTRRHSPTYLARRVDLAAGLRERSLTALELGARGEEFPLALAQMRDAVEHLKRVEPLETFPLRAPRRELAGAALVTALCVMVAFAPNPWAVRARSANPAIAVAREQAQRVERLAESLQVQENPDLEQLRELLRRGARTVDARSNEPEAALGALEDLEERLRQLSAGDDQLAAALAAIAGALAGDPATSDMATAINSGDLREISRAARNLGQRTEAMDGAERERLSRTLRDAAGRASRASPQLASSLGEAADALRQGGSGAGEEGGESGQMMPGSQRGGQQGGRSAREALGDVANDAAAAAERQRAQSQLEGSRNALERALGRSQSRSGSAQGNRSSSASQRQRSGAGGEEGSGQGESAGGGEQGEGQGSASGASAGGEDGEGGQPGQSGAGSGTLNRSASGVSELDTITRAENVGGSHFVPDEMTDNPFLGDAEAGSSRVGDAEAKPSFARRSTQGGDSASIPLGLRDLVKDYFSALDQK